MKKLFLIFFATVIGNLCIAQTMLIHTSGGVDDYNLSDVDSITFSLQSSEIPSEGLVAYYPFNGNANDESGNGHNGTINGASLTTDRFGNSNSAYSFDGVDDYIKIPHNSALNFGANGEFTICAWVYLPDNLPSTDTPIFNKTGANSTGETFGDSWGYRLTIRSNGKYLFNCTSNGTGNSAESTDALSPNSWYFLVGRRTSENVELFLDANLKASELNTKKDVSSEAALIFGAKLNVNNKIFFKGKMDDCLIYNRALSNKEIQSMLDQ